MGKADEERLAIGVQKYPCLYDKAVSAFHNKNQKKNAWEAVAKDIGLETGEATKNAFTSLRNENLLLVSSFSTLSSITNKARAHIFFFLNESAAIMSISFDFGAIIIFYLV